MTLLRFFTLSWRFLVSSISLVLEVQLLRGPSLKLVALNFTKSLEVWKFWEDCAPIVRLFSLLKRYSANPSRSRRETPSLSNIFDMSARGFVGFHYLESFLSLIYWWMHSRSNSTSGSYFYWNIDYVAVSLKSLRCSNLAVRSIFVIRFWKLSSFLTE